MKHKGMILSAGFGTRLKPLTDTLPKALVEFKGKPMIEYQIDRLKNAGCEEIIINTHHFADKMEEYFYQRDFGIKIRLSYEPEILGTGGGILNAEKYLNNCDYFFVINVDVDTDFDLNEMKDEWERIFLNRGDKMEDSPLAMLLVQKRKTSRYLEFDEKMKLIGRATDSTPEERKFAFNGVHIISNKIFSMGLNKEFLDILNIYLSLNENCIGLNSGNSSFKDIGKAENLN
ncbi:MAG TPA: sugar phosphate nucleotidyltransferase [Ignavibacteria bacterium]|nr:sugar phosphate nucleotidyltransferase [Ignavibacteria bacterium]